MVKLDHVKIVVADWKKSRDWYVNNLGLVVEFEVPQGGGAALGVAALQDDSGMTLFLEQSAGPVSRCQCGLTFQVDDVERKHAELTARGISFLRAPQKLYWGYGAELTDPDGHLIHLWDEKSMRNKGGAG
jgi:catechol 2,3-dioxygenase-like lactoylglutathione lyase family enzyme